MWRSPDTMASLVTVQIRAMKQDPMTLIRTRLTGLTVIRISVLRKNGKVPKKVADAMKEEGWLFASHTWGHQNIGQISLETLQADTQKFKDNVDPLIGGTDIIIFAFGTDITTEPEYSGDKFEYLKGQGYNYFCNVDSSQYYVQIRDRYFRQGRRNLDGYRMYYNPELLEDLFNAKDVFDPARPTPVPPMG